MASLRTLFLGVHTSNSLIRVLFLPLCYIALLSPFTLAVLWYFGFGQTLHRFVPEDFSWFDILPQIALSAVLLLLPTRLLSATRNVAKSKNGRKRRVQSLPYWIPGLRHLSSIILGGEDWLKTIRDSSLTNIVAYNAAATKHNIVLSAPMLDQLYQCWNALEESTESKWAVVRNAFSMPKTARTKYFELAPEISKIVESEIYNGAQMESLLKASLSTLSEALPDFVTFNSSIVDQMQWERVSNLELTDGTSEAECDLFTLINEFCCTAILPPIMGTQFTESYQLLATDLASFNQRYWALALGLPRLSPIRGLPGAALAQKRLLHNFTKLFKELTNPPVRRVPDDDESVSGEEETDADIVTPFMKLNKLFTQHDVPMELRAVVALQLVHGIFAEVVPLTFWTLLHIYSASGASSGETTPLESVKTETRLWAQAFQPPSIHPSFPAPPEIRFASVSEIVSPKSFLYLKSCIDESRRLYNCPISTYQTTQSIILEEAGIARPGEQEQWELGAGSYVDIGLSSSLINSAEANYISANSFKADRFVDSPTPSSIRSPIDSSQDYKSALLVSLIAGITQLWDIAPAPKKSFLEHMQEAGAEASMGAAALSGEEKEAKDSAKKEKAINDKKVGKWVIPKGVDGASVKIPKADVRVRIRRREGLPASKIVRRIG